MIVDKEIQRIDNAYGVEYRYKPSEDIEFIFILRETYLAGFYAPYFCIVLNRRLLYSVTLDFRPTAGQCEYIFRSFLQKYDG